MLQIPHSQIPLHPQERDAGLNLGQYVQVFKKRWPLFVVPLLVVFAIGLVIVILRPATYASQGKLLVEIAADSVGFGSSHRHRHSRRTYPSDRATRHDAGQSADDCGQVSGVRRAPQLVWWSDHTVRHRGVGPGAKASANQADRA